MRGASDTSVPVESWSVLIAANDAAELLTLVTRVGATIAGEWSIADLAAQAATPVLVDALLMDLRDATEQPTADAAAAARRIADERGLGVVAAIDATQIDLVAVELLGRPHHLLCDPTPAEIMVALVNARTAPEILGGVAADESERLRQLNSEVARIAETLARLTRSDIEPPAGNSAARDRRLGFGMPPIEDGAPVDAREVRNLIRARRMRDTCFPADLFADPAWDMLLDLFAAELEHRRVSVSSLCIAAAVPGTTALRWIGTMVDVGLFERQADPFDRRRAYITLTIRAREALVRYFDAVRRAGVFAG